MDRENVVIVSVDGPSASGKSTVSRGVAHELGFTYCDSGSLYRAITWKALEEGIDLSDEKAVLEMLARTEWVFLCGDKTMEFSIDGVNPGQKLRLPEVCDNVSTIAQMAGVREFVVEHLRSITSCGSLVMEGRDIGSVVFPDAGFKYFLDASAEERARRRYAEYVSRKQGDDIEQVYQSLQRRDQTDSTRKTAPLSVPDDAVVIDSTTLDQREVIELILKDIRERMGDL